MKTNDIRKSVSFNPHWFDGVPSWDIVLPTGVIFRDITRRDISAVTGGYVPEVVRVCDIQAFGCAAEENIAKGIPMIVSPEEL